LPPSVDSSNARIITEGLSAYDSKAGRPMINSLALERLETLDLVKEYDARVIATAAGAAGMPSDDEERVANVNEVMDAVISRGVPLNDVYVDPLVFPIAVERSYGNHYLDAVRALRVAYGDELHITGGLSNVSFGLPKRGLINDTFIHLALDAGIDSGIIDPIQTKLGGVFELDTESEPVRLASDMLLGRDDYCVEYIQAFRDGRLG
jgi:5-methyltetrahydrofolate--homocysteine methyltransferase